MQQRGLSLSELSDLSPQMYDLYFIFCEYIEPRNGYTDSVNTALIMQSVYQTSTGKPVEVQELHYLIPKQKRQKVERERPKLTLAEAERLLKNNNKG